MRRLVGVHSLTFSVLVLVAVYATWPLARHAGTQVSDLGDPLEVAWIFGWSAHAIVHAPLHLFDANMFNPEGLTLAYAENLLGLSLPVAPIFWLTGNAILTVNVATIVLLAVGGFGVYLLVREVTGSTGPALLAGAAFAAAPYRLAQLGMGHTHVVAVHLTPFVLLLLLRIGREPTRRRLIALALLVALQWWSSLTGGIITMLAIGTWAAWELVRRQWRAWPQLWRAWAAVAVGMVLTVPVVLPYVRARQLHPDYTHAPIEAVELSARPQSYLSAPPSGAPALESTYAWLAQRFADPVSAGEKRLFPGFWLLGASVLTIVAAAVAFIRRRAGPLVAVVALFAGIAVVGFVLSLGPRYGADVHGMRMPFAVLNKAVPGGLVRVPARLGMLTQLGLALLAGAGLAMSPARFRRVLVALSAVLLGLEVMPPHFQLGHPPALTSAHRAIAQRDGVVLALPTVEFTADGALVSAGIPREAQHLYLSTANFRPLTNGYGAYHPPSFFDLARAVRDLPSDTSLLALRQRHVRTVVVQTGLTPGTAWAGVEARLLTWPGIRRIATGRDVQVFDVTQAAVKQP